jgi:hypothetical protein
MPRLEGWEARLAAVIEAARREPYALGEHDCFRLACRVIEAMTGVDRWPEFRGYRTKREALRRIAERGANFEAAGDWFFGSGRVDTGQARRGDIVALATADGGKHLGVCLDHRVAYLSEEGLIFLPLATPAASPAATLCAWRIG